MSSPKPSRPDRPFREEVFQDAARIWGEKRPSFRHLVGAFLKEFGLAAAMLFRLAQRLHHRGHPVLAALVTRLNLALHGCYISVDAEVGSGLRIAHPWGVGVGAGVRLGEDVILYQSVSLAARRWQSGEYPVIGNRVTVFANSVVVGSIRLGDDCRVGACSVVLDDVPAGTTVAGAPARPLKSSNGASPKENTQGA